jgi:hypothetical protein
VPPLGASFRFFRPGHHNGDQTPEGASCISPISCQLSVGLRAVTDHWLLITGQ